VVLLNEVFISEIYQYLPTGLNRQVILTHFVLILRTLF